MWIKHLALLALLGLAASPVCFADDDDESVADLLVDELLSLLTSELSDGGYSELSISELNGTVSKKIAFVTLKASFQGEGGWLKNLTTIQRTGSTTMTSTDSTVSLEVSLGLDELSFGFERFAINFLGIKLHGSLNASIETNSVTAALSVVTDDDDDSCSTEVNSVTVTDLDGIDVKITGHNSISDWVYEKITEIVVSKIKKTIKSALSEALEETLTSILAENEICDLLSL